MLSGAVLTFGVVVVDVIANKVKLVRFLVRCWRRGLVPVIALGGLLLVAIALPLNLSNLPLILRGALQYIWIALVPAVFGLGYIYVKREAIGDPMRIIIFWLLVSTMLVLLQSEIAPLLPWASRRLMMYTVPLVALLGAIVFGVFSERHMAWP